MEYRSCFNIEMSFSVSDIQTMIQEYEQEHRTGMDVKEPVGFI